MTVRPLTAAAEEIPLPVNLLLTGIWAASDTTTLVRPLATAGPLDWQEVKERMQQVEQQQQRELASAFVERIKDEPHVREVWASFAPSLDVTVIVEGRDLEEELRLYAILRDLSADMLRPTLGDLAVIPAPYHPEGETRLFPISG